MGKTIRLRIGERAGEEKKVSLGYQDYAEEGERRVEVYEDEEAAVVVEIRRPEEPILSFALSPADADMLTAALALRHHT